MEPKQPGPSREGLWRTAHPKTLQGKASRPCWHLTYPPPPGPAARARSELSDCSGDCQPVRDKGGRNAGRGAEETGIIPARGFGRKASLWTFLGESPQGGGGGHGQQEVSTGPSAAVGPAVMGREAAGTGCGWNPQSQHGGCGTCVRGRCGAQEPCGARGFPVGPCPRLLLAGSSLPLAPPLPGSRPPIGQRLHPMP